MLRLIAICIFLLFIPTNAKAYIEKKQGIEEERKLHVYRLYSAFQEQQNARSYWDVCCACQTFNIARDALLAMGEPHEKITAIQNLWTWYRTYGYSCGLIAAPVKCPGEFLRSNSFLTTDLTPRQKQQMRNFLLGVGGIISGVFCIAVNPTTTWTIGVPSIASGAGLIWNAVDNMLFDYDEKQARRRELKQLEQQAENATKLN